MKKFVLKNLSSGTIENFRKIRQLGLLAWRDVRYDLLGHIWPIKPATISFMANDICNSRCVMCSIWKQKQDKELNPAQFRRILAESLFSRVQHIGITGGEPTLRSDLPQLFKVIADRKPRIKAVSLTTNAIREEEVQGRVLECAQICRGAGLSFGIMVSLDGLEDIHDINRGRPGNFKSAVNCIFAFQQAGLPVSLGCTITKENVAYVDELLDWAIENNVPARFRVAEFIQRLNNDSQKDHIRNFNKLELYHLGLFFRRLYVSYEKKTSIQKTYKNIQGMLAEGGKRKIGCPCHTNTVILSAKGELLYCSPKSPILGSILEKKSARRVYFGNLDKRKEIRQKYCDDCIHDYHVPVSFLEKIGFYLKCRRIKRLYDCNSLLQISRKINRKQSLNINPDKQTSSRVLIVGWYGTETAGDKAILWSIVQRLKQRSRPPEEIIISSLNPFITEWTKREMGLEELKIVETYSSAFKDACKSVDEVIVGGGPLMDLELLNHILFAFITVSKRGKICRIEGCGLGPLEKPIYIQVVHEILRLSDHISLRDMASVNRCQSEFGYQAFSVVDPAKEYVTFFQEQHENTKDEDSSYVNFFLRQLPKVYVAHLEQDDYEILSFQIEQQLLDMMALLIQKKGLSIRLLPMNTHVDGGDDRIYNRLLARKLVLKGIASDRIEVARYPLSPAQILEKMLDARFNVCMRYHSVFFAASLGTNFLAIDYTDGGKVKGFLDDKGFQKKLITLDELTSGQWESKLNKLMI